MRIKTVTNNSKCDLLDAYSKTVIKASEMANSGRLVAQGISRFPIELR